MVPGRWLLSLGSFLKGKVLIRSNNCWGEGLVRVRAPPLGLGLGFRIKVRVVTLTGAKSLVGGLLKEGSPEEYGFILGSN